MVIILFRGGMVGDLIALMVDKSIKTLIKDTPQSNVVGHLLDTNRTKLKKFWKYDNAWKMKYISEFNDSEIIMSHDTDFSNCISNSTIQVICSDMDRIRYFATRFYNLNKSEVIKHTHERIGVVSDFITDYSNDIVLWQDNIKFKNRFDVCNLGTPQFLYDVIDKFAVSDTKWASEIYKEWRDVSIIN